jgi:hypothetical protein
MGTAKKYILLLAAISFEGTTYTKEQLQANDELTEKIRKISPSIFEEVDAATPVPDGEYKITGNGLQGKTVRIEKGKAVFVETHKPAPPKEEPPKPAVEIPKQEPPKEEPAAPK